MDMVTIALYFTGYNAYGVRDGTTVSVHRLAFVLDDITRSAA